MSDDVNPPLTTTTSIWPAASVLIVAVAMLVIFIVLNGATNQSISSTSTTVPIIVGGLATDVNSTLLQNCISNGTIPTNILPAMLIPIDTTSTGTQSIPNTGAGDYDCYKPLKTTASYQDVLGFYKSHLTVLGWNLFSSGTTNGGPQYLFQKSGSDGFYWIVGITVTSPTSQLTTNWKYRIYQNSSI
jgi:hypothetical protein